MISDDGCVWLVVVLIVIFYDPSNDYDPVTEPANEIVLAVLNLDAVA